MSDDLKERTISGMLWSSVGKFGTLGLQFVSNLILARLLMPDDYGVVGMLHIFIAVSSIFVTAGFGSALIQKKNPTHIDYTSVFYWNLVAAFIFYGILYVCGPSIAGFYNMPELCWVLRIQSLSLIIQAFSTIQSNQLQKQLRFRELSIRNIVAQFVGTLVAVIMAFYGCGVWSLVASNLVSSVASVMLLWRMSRWRPTLEFSWASLRELFSFGGLMALSAFVETLYSNIQGLIIGKWYSPSILGYYSQARKLEEVPTSAMSQIVNQVSFPVFSALQDDKQRLRLGVRKNIKSIVYINFPLMILLIVIARPLVLLLYGEKWEVSIHYFQILCLYGMVYAMNTINTNVVKSLGKSGVFFVIQLVKRLIGIVLIIIGANIGIYGLLWAITSVGYISLLINMFANKKLISYGLVEQMKDVWGALFLASATGVVVYFACHLIPVHQYLVMAVEVVLYALLYVGLSKVCRMEAFGVYRDVVVNKIRRK